MPFPCFEKSPRLNGQSGWKAFALALTTVAIAGCSQLPSPPKRPSLSPSQAAKEALSEYDTNGDGQIDRIEGTACPGLLAAFARIDENQDEQVSADEIADRVRYYKTANTTILNGAVRVTLDGRPLPGAEVTLEPEAFLGSAFTTCTGQTDDFGEAILTGHDAEFPGIYLGMYRVRISRKSNGKEIVPPQYNTETTLGYEAADDIPDVSNVPHFRLDQSK